MNHDGMVNAQATAERMASQPEIDRAFGSLRGLQQRIDALADAHGSTIVATLADEVESVRAATIGLTRAARDAAQRADLLEASVRDREARVEELRRALNEMEVHAREVRRSAGAHVEALVRALRERLPASTARAAVRRAAEEGRRASRREAPA